MFHPSLGAGIAISNWRVHPPRGQEMRSAFSNLIEDELVAELSRLCGRSPSYVNWHLASKAIVPACLLVAALKFAQEKSFFAAAQITSSIGQ